MAAGPFARIISQVLVVAGGAIGRAVFQAYREAAARGAQNPNLSRALPIRRRMLVEEARNVLDVKPQVEAEEIIRRFEKLNELNAESEGTKGSTYLQSKIAIAKDILLDDIAAKEAKEGAKKAADGIRNEETK